MVDDYIGVINQDRFKNTKELSKFLSKELSEKGYVNIVEDDALKEACLKNAFNGYTSFPVYDDVFRPIVSEGTSSSSMEGAMDNAVSKLKEKAAKAGANYMFTKTTFNNHTKVYSDYHSGYGSKPGAYEAKGNDVFSVSIIATPYSIIGERELEELKTVYASGAPYEVSKAAKKYFGASLEHDFADLYSNNPWEFQIMFACLGKEKRIEIIKKVQNIKVRNPSTDEWLSERYAEEVEASLVDGITGNEEAV